MCRELGVGLKEVFALAIGRTPNLGNHSNLSILARYFERVRQILVIGGRWRMGPVPVLQGALQACILRGPGPIVPILHIF